MVIGAQKKLFNFYHYRHLNVLLQNNTFFFIFKEAVFFDNYHVQYMLQALGAEQFVFFSLGSSFLSEKWQKTSKYVLVFFKLDVPGLKFLQALFVASLTFDKVYPINLSENLLKKLHAVFAGVGFYGVFFNDFSLLRYFKNTDSPESIREKTLKQVYNDVHNYLFYLTYLLC